MDKGSTRIDTEFARRDPDLVVAENSWESYGPFDFETGITGRDKRLVILVKIKNIKKMDVIYFTFYYEY